MLDKAFLVNKVADTLRKNEYEVFLTEGSFDIAAKREHLLLIKTLLNADSLTEDQALSLRAISHFVSAYPFVVSLKNNREFLNKEIVYSRFELPVLTPEFFDDIIFEEAVAINSAKGRHTIEVNSFALREKRKELKLTLDELAESAGISKKALYEIENKRVNPTSKTTKRLESILKIELQMPYEMKTVSSVYLKPKDEFEKNVSKEFSRIGIDNSPVYSSPFEIIGKESFSLVTGVAKDAAKIKKSVNAIKEISSFLSAKALFVSKKIETKTTSGLPVILESDLSEIETPSELEKLIEEKY